jgi:hypothetical protein
VIRVTAIRCYFVLFACRTGPLGIGYVEKDTPMTTTATAVRFNKPADHLASPMGGALNLAPLVGTWVNENTATRDIVKVVLTDNAGTLEVQAFGACSPTPCNWGQIAGLAYAATVAGGSAVAFSANYAFGFKNTILTGHLNGETMIVDDFNVFEDGSGRSPYFTQGKFKKSRKH